MRKRLHINIYQILIFCATIFMSIGYATVNSVTLDVTGLVQATLQDGVFITDVSYVSSNNVDLSNSRIINAYKTNLNSNIVLLNFSNSSITYQITIYNSTNYDYEFDEVKYLKCNNDYILCESYSNENIVFSLDGLEVGTIISSKATRTFNITFYYKNNVVSSNKELKSYLNFKFSEVDKVYLVNGPTLNLKIKNSNDAVDNNVNKIIFDFYDNYSDIINWNSYESYVDSLSQGTIRLFRKTDSNNYTTVYILSDKTIYANENCNTMFMNLRSVESIDFDNFDTSYVTSMLRMFYMFYETESSYSSSLLRLDLSDWDTSNVTTMRAMFGYNNNLLNIDVSGWDTSSVTNMGYLFQNCESLTELDVSNFDTSNVTTLQGMFMRLSNIVTLDLSSFDTSNVEVIQSMFSMVSPYQNETDTKLKTIYVGDKFVTNKLTDVNNSIFEGCTELVGGNGTKYDSNNIGANYAIVDRAVYDESGNYISGNKGYFTHK